MRPVSVNPTIPLEQERVHHGLLRHIPGLVAAGDFEAMIRKTMEPSADAA